MQIEQYIRLCYLLQTVIATYPHMQCKSNFRLGPIIIIVLSILTVKQQC